MPKLTYITNARILTMDPAQPEAWGIGIAEGRVKHIFPQDGALPFTADSTVIDAHGMTVVPGFNDCHMHILPYGLDLARADLSPAAGVTDVPSLVAALRRWCDGTPPSEWALGSRYDQNTFPGAAHPTRKELDAAFPDRPVF